MNPLRYYSRLPLRWKILLPFLIMSVLVSFASTYVLGRSLEGQVYDQAGEEVSNEARLAASYVQRERVYLVESLRVTVQEASVLASAQGTAGEVLASTGTQILLQIMSLTSGNMDEVDLVKVLGPQNEVYFELHADMAEGGTLDDGAMVEKVLAGESVGALVTTTDHSAAYMVGATPLPLSETQTGVIAVGQKIDQSMLAGIELPGRTLLAFTDQGVIASSDPGRGYDGGAWTEALLNATDGTDRVVQVGDSEYVLASAPLEAGEQANPVHLATVMSVDPLAAQARVYWLIAWMIFAAGVVALAVVGHVVARRVALPVRQLTAATAQVKSGDFGTQIAIDRSDDIGELAKAFNIMSHELRERDERLTETFNEVKRLSETDSLTGLLNHRMITEQVTKEVARARRYGGRFGLMVMDLDNFKLLNDTYGHPVGDDALRQVSRLLLEQSREADFVGRHGGDEFMLVLPECGPLELSGVAEKLQSVFAESGFQAPDGVVVPIKMSMGVACYPDDGEDVNTLMALADANLYVAKSQGGDGVAGIQLEGASVEDVSAFGMLGSLVTIVDNKDRYTRHHSEEVTEIALTIAGVLGLSDESKRVLRVAGLLHDIGKIGVPDRILRKPGYLTDDEYEIVKQHSTLADAIIAAIPDIEETRAAVLAHHERYDGTGYPGGLKGDKIPLLARILAVADAYSAMTTDRPYRKALSREEAIAELVSGKDSQFDSDCVEAFLEAVDSGEGHPADKTARKP